MVMKYCRSFMGPAAFCTIAIGFSVIAMSQTTNQMQIGTLWETPGGLEAAVGLQGQYLVWPGGYDQGSSPYAGGIRTNSSGALLRFVFQNFVQQIKDSAGQVVETDTLPFYEPGYAAKSLTQAYQPTSVMYVKAYQTPTTVIYEDGTSHKNTVLPQSRTLIVTPSLISDEMIQYTEYYSNGFYVLSKYYEWANQYHDDYVIRVVDIVNNGNTDDNISTSEIPPVDLPHMYFDYYVNNLTPNAKGEGEYSFPADGTWDNWHDYYGDSQNDSLRFMYAFDGDDPQVPGDDQGDPFPSQFVDDQVYNPDNLYSAGEFLSSMYAGYGMIHCDSSTAIHQDALGQPFTYGYGDYTKAPGWDNAVRWAYIYNAGARSFEHPNYSGSVPLGLESCWMGFGPFDLAPHGDLRLVFVHAVNGPSVAANKLLGAEYLKGSITQQQKNAFLSTGFDSLLLSMDRAKWNWDNYLSKNLSIPDGPTPPANLVIKDTISSILLSWSASPSKNVASYKVYRKAGDNMGDFTLVATLPPTQTAYADTSAGIGVSYYYYVTAETDGSQNIDPTCFHQPLESSKFFNRSAFPARAYRAASATLGNVRVVPNPFNLRQTLAYPGEVDRLTFTNLTHHCVIKIFTVDGNLVKTLEKNNSSAYIVWSPMLTDDNLFIAPDIYIYYIQVS